VPDNPITTDGNGPRAAENVAKMELSVLSTKLHVLVPQEATSPVPPFKMPGVLGELAIIRNTLPAG
jgi:hypothetical protein